MANPAVFSIAGTIAPKDAFQDDYVRPSAANPWKVQYGTNRMILTI